MSEPVAPTEPNQPSPASDQASDEWRRMLTGEDRSLPRLRRMLGAIPSSPRCKMCAAPFRGPGGLVTRVMQHGQSTANPLMCSACFGHLRKMPGGAEVDLSVLFADIRGSTGIAERTSAGEFRRLVQQFYYRAAGAVDASDGIIDKFLGDGIMVLFLPVTAGDSHAAKAIDAGEAILHAVTDRDLVEGGVRVGVGVHTGDAFVGAVGAADKLDFTALGDTVNVAARLGGEAGAGELLVSDAAWAAAGRPDPLEHRHLAVKGRQEPLGVVVVRNEVTAASATA